MTEMNVKTATLEVDLTAEAQLEMEAINTFKGPQGEKGDKGDRGLSGVELSPVEPTDQDVRVWIDESGEADEDMVIDPTLTMPGHAADAKVTGDRFNSLSEDIVKLFGANGLDLLLETTITEENVATVRCDNPDWSTKYKGAVIEVYLPEQPVNSDVGPRISISAQNGTIFLPQGKNGSFPKDKAATATYYVDWTTTLFKTFMVYNGYGAAGYPMPVQGTSIKQNKKDNPIGSYVAITQRHTSYPYYPVNSTIAVYGVKR